MRLFFIIAVLVLFGCNASNTPSFTGQKATSPAWLQSAMVDSVWMRLSSYAIAGFLLATTLCR
ncbi:MAG: hypothetical protein IT211_14050 [Armatimonadetes bacterium]|nr:hypothetical protein [Armatimonadota bacterium]